MAAGSDNAEQCPVDHTTRERWLQAAKTRGQQAPASTSVPHAAPPSVSTRFSLDTMSWRAVTDGPRLSSTKRPRLMRLSTDREISTIPRAVSENHAPNSAERAAMRPANSERDTGHDRESGNWIYPSQEMFFNAMKRKGYDPEATDMTSIVPIHNAVNERAWDEIKKWEAGRGGESCGGPKLVSFAGDSKALTPKARFNSLLGYQKPFDRHDWVVDRCGKHIDYVIDFYPGKDSGDANKSVSFYVDVRPKVNSWEGIKMRMQNALGL